MIEGSDDGAREDELDLGPEEDTMQPISNGVTHDISPQPQKGPEAGSMADLEEDLPNIDTQDRASAQPTPTPAADATDGILPSPRPDQLNGSGSMDETTSTPDDTPSLHVRCDRCFSPSNS